VGKVAEDRAPLGFDVTITYKNIGAAFRFLSVSSARL